MLITEAQKSLLLDLECCESVPENDVDAQKCTKLLQDE
jgi:hypothetical protein